MLTFTPAYERYQLVTWKAVPHFRSCRSREGSIAAKMGPGSRSPQGEASPGHAA